MADYPAPGSATAVSSPPTTAALLAYILLGFAALTQIAGSGIAVPAPLLTLIGILGIIIVYVKRDEARATWLESHMTWLIRTFWWSTIWALIGWIVLVLLAIVLIGFALGPLIWAVTAIWVLYRVIRGILYYKDQRPIPGV
jgi:uncharacterized membrane protein